MQHDPIGVRSAVMVAITAMLVASVVGPTSAAPRKFNPRKALVLVEREWTLPAFAEAYRCHTRQAAADIHLGAFRPVMAEGTFAMTVTVSDTASTLGDYDCSPVTTGQGVFSARGGTGDLLLPGGTAIRVRSGQFVTMTLHVFNSTGAPLSGRSGVLVQTTTASRVDHEVEMVLLGTMDIAIPNTGVPVEVSGACLQNSASNIVAFSPRMNALGTRTRVQLIVSGSAVQTLLDVPFDPADQSNYPVVPPAPVVAAAELAISCTYVNSGAFTVMYGDSVADERCETAVYRYPATARNINACIEGP